MDQTDLDHRIQAYYSGQFDEGDRLVGRSAQGRLEFERVQELVLDRVPPGSRIADIGGATGVHAAPLAARGYDVTLLDPVLSQVEEAAKDGSFRAVLGDARSLPFERDAFDAALLFGPPYHLASREDRLAALREAGRVVRSGGWILAAAIPRLARLAAISTGVAASHPFRADWVALLEHGRPTEDGRFPGGHFHTADELEGELGDAGLTDVSVCAVEGPDGFGFEQLPVVPDDVHEAALTVVRAIGHLPGVRELSSHIMGIARVP